MHPVDQRGRRFHAVGLDQLLDQLVADPGVGVAHRLVLQVGADGGPEAGEVLEIADLARERVVERRQLLALHLVQRHPQLPCLAPAALVGVVVGEADLGFGHLARHELHDLLLERGQGLPLAEDDRVRLRLGGRALLERGHVHLHHLARGGLLALDREPGGLLLAEPGDLLLDLRVGDRRALRA